MTDRWRWLVLALSALPLQCTSDSSDASCDCAPGEVCAEGVCRAVCGDAADCGACQECVGQICLPISGCCTGADQDTGCVAVCGDGVVQGNEACDDGNRKDGDFCSADCTAQGPQVAVYLLAGQSNMDGYGNFSELNPTDVPQKGTRLRWLNDASWGDVRPASSVANGFGPEIGLALAVNAAYPQRPTVFIKYAVGGSTLHTEWAPGEDEEDTPGTLYSEFIEGVNDTLRALEGGGEVPVLAGLLWMQGESDGATAQNASAYEANLERFVRRTREDLGAPILPVVIGRINAPEVQERKTLRVAQTRVAEKVHNTLIVSTDDLSRVDSVHYDTRGQLTLGQRMAEALIQHTPEPFVPEPPVGDVLAEVVPEAWRYRLLSELPVPVDTDFNDLVDLQAAYTIDNGNALAGIPYDRVGYLMTLRRPGLAERYIWISIRTFSQDLTRVGVPVDTIAAQSVGHLNVVSNVTTVEPVVGAADGHVENWSYCYNKGADNRYNHQDTLAEGTPNCYGSMQIHRGSVTQMAYNAWSTGREHELGIGPQSEGEPDWTLARNATAYAERTLRVYVQPASPDDLPTSGFRRVYGLEIPASADWNTPGDVPYATNLAGALEGFPFDRVAYRLELTDASGTHFVWAEMDTPSSQLKELGVPVNKTHNQGVSNLTVVSNHPDVRTVTGSNAGALEFWSHCYEEGPDGAFDADDKRLGSDCYGSMQIHDNGVPVFAFNRWSASEPDIDLGLGASSGSHPDWTGAANAATFSQRRLDIFVAHSRVSESAEYTPVYVLDVPTVANWDTDADVVYRIDHRSSLAGRKFDRIAYYVELDDRYAWVSMDATGLAATANDLSVPTDSVIAGAATDMNVYSNAPGLPEVVEGSSGSVEFWSHCYSPGPDGRNDAQDVRTETDPDCYGSMQVHQGGVTVFAFNRWSSTNPNIDVGLGPGTSEPDWTFAENAAAFTKRRIHALVRLVD